MTSLWCCQINRSDRLRHHNKMVNGMLGRLVSEVTLVTLLLVVTVVAMAMQPADPFYDRLSLEPPRRPEHFHSIDELTRYLDELKQYYTLLGRPRYVHFLLHTSTTLCCCLFQCLNISNAFINFIWMYVNTHMNRVQSINQSINFMYYTRAEQKQDIIW